MTNKLIDPEAYELLGKLYLDALTALDRDLLYAVKRAVIVSHSGLPIDASLETRGAYVLGFFDGKVQEVLRWERSARRRRTRMS